MLEQSRPDPRPLRLRDVNIAKTLMEVDFHLLHPGGEKPQHQQHTLQHDSGTGITDAPQTATN